MSFFSYLLFPFASLFNIATSIRNRWYDAGFIGSKGSRIPTICVGNLRVGGTGKTPFVEYLLKHLLVKQLKTGVLSRGYGRRTKGFLQADINMTAKELGDEPLQYYKKFGPDVPVFVGEDRVGAIAKIEALYPFLDVVVLDDAYQHRPFKARTNILLSEYGRPFYQDYLLPMGRLRESRTGAKRADLVVVTKCPPNLSHEEMSKVKAAVGRYTESDVFFATIDYGPLTSVRNGISLDSHHEVVLVTGIDNPTPFIAYCRSFFNVREELRYPDHYEFSKQDIQLMVNIGCPIITTEKDMSRLEGHLSELNSLPLFYIPIEMRFIQGEEFFWKRLEATLSAS